MVTLMQRNAADPIAALIRRRREALGWSLAKLADASGIRSPSYVFHLENGHKAPSVAVARRIAAALAEDEELFRAWALVRGRGDLPSVLGASRVLDEALRLREPGEAAALESKPAAPGTVTPAIVSVAFLPEGADPDDPAVVAFETLSLDARVLPPLARFGRLFGYRLSAHGARRAPDVLRHGDCVVIGSDDEPPRADGLYALRVGGRIELGRAEPHDAPVVAGKMILAFRRWL